MTWYRFGQFQEGPLTAEVVSDVVAEARTRTARIRAVPVEEIVEILHATGRLLASDHPLRRQALEEMPAIVGFERSMVEAGLDTLTGMLERDNLMIRLRADLDDPWLLDEFRWNAAFEGYVRAEPRGIVAHVAAGNVFVGAIDSVIQGLVSKNVNLLKMAGADPLFPLLFVKALHECDPKRYLTESLALLPFRGGDTAVESVLKQGCDTIVVYGGTEAVEAYRQGLSLHNRLVEYGPKYSCVVLDADHVGPEVARAVAQDFTMWEQSACSSPHVVFVLGPAREFAERLAEAMEGWLGEYPKGPVPFQEQVEITRTRELARVGQALGEGELLVGDPTRQDWTVIYETEPTFRVSCHHRTAYVKPVDSLEAVLDVLRPYGQFIQTVALGLDTATRFSFGQQLTQLGADRLVSPGEQSKRKHGTPHDGTRGLAELVRWVSLARTPVKYHQDHFDYLEDEQRDEVTLARLNRLLEVCREKCDFYRPRVGTARFKDLSELAKIPVTSQSEFRAHLPPQGTGVLTAPLGNSYSFGSGGTTGAPKFIYRTVEETERNSRAIGKGMYLSGFAQPGDVVGNLLFAGNMWASFLSLGRALEVTGCHILPVAGNIEMDAIAQYLMAFKANSVMSVPSILISLAQYVKANNLDLKIEKMGYGGEHLFPQAQQQIRDILGTERFISVTYAANDTGAVGFQCRCGTGGDHHIHEHLHIVEILDPETEKPVAPGQVGKIVVTNIDRILMPTIRFDIGDMGRMLTGPCGCGRRLRRLELLGRSDEVLIIGGVNVSLTMVADCVGEVPGLSFHFRMVAKLDGMRDKLVVEVESQVPVEDSEAAALAEELRRVLHREKKEFDAFLRTGSIAAPEVVVLKPDGLPRNPRTGKIKQVVDDRHNA